MRNLFSILILSVLLSGCSILPRITTDTAGTTPQSINKTYKKEVCKGKFTYDEAGNPVCSKGYYVAEKNYDKKERKYTFQERIANFIRGLTAWGFWGVLGLSFLCPGFLGWFLGAVFNVFRKSLTSTVKAIAKFKTSIPTVIVDGEEVRDPAYVKAIDTLLDELERAYAQDKSVLKTIMQIRTELKVQDND